jgi:hypothetical protein
MFWKNKKDKQSISSDIKFEEDDLNTALIAYLTCASPIMLDSLHMGWHNKRYHEMWIEDGGDLESLLTLCGISVIGHTQTSWELIDKSDFDAKAAVEYHSNGDEILFMRNAYKKIILTDNKFKDFISKHRKLGYHDASGKQNANWQMFPFRDFIPMVKTSVYNLRVEDINNIDRLLEKHGEKLNLEIKRLTQLNTDKYGILNNKPIIQEIEYLLRVSHADIKTLTLENAAFEAWDLCEAKFRNSTPTEEPSLSGEGFEQWCLSKLHDLGFDAYLTPPGPDQGIDIISEINGRRVGIQCKFYTGSVGNAAVQEVLSGKGFYMLDEACVISTGRFTKSAQELAKMTGAVLLSDLEIYNIADHY